MMTAQEQFIPMHDTDEWRDFYAANKDALDEIGDEAHCFALAQNQALVVGGDRDTAQLLSVAILELRIKLNQIDDSELKALCDAMLREAETAEHSRLQKSHEAPRGRSSVTLKLVK